MLSIVLTLAGKDWRLFWSDRRSAALAFLVPILLASTFGYIFDRPTRKRADIRLHLLVVAEGDSAELRGVIEDLKTNPNLNVEFVCGNEIESRLFERRPGVAAVIPTDFGDAAGRPVIEIRHHPLCSLEARWAEGALAEIVTKRVVRERWGPIAGAIADQAPFDLRTTELTGREAQFNSYSHSFCGMTLQYLLFWGMESGLLLLRERRRGVWLRLRAAPAPFAAILFGRALATAAIAILQLLATFAFGHFAFGVSLGDSPFAFVLAACAIGILAASVGLLVAALGGRESPARSVSILAILGLAMLGGLWLPSFLLPGWLRDVSLALPTTWAMRLLDSATWQGRDLASMFPSFAAVLGFAAFLLSLALWRFHATERSSRRGRA
jgi:ABC-2 type transport system permease protein